MPSDLNHELSAFLEGKNEAALRGARLQHAWEQVASPSELEHTDNIVWDKNAAEPVLMVFVDDSAWAAELNMEHELKRRMIEHQLKQPVARIRFLVSRDAAYKKDFSKADMQPPGYLDDIDPVALDTKEEEELCQSLLGITDPNLKEKLYKAFKHDKEWKKGIKAQKNAQKPPYSPE